jgi:hypothetical protein
MATTRSAFGAHSLCSIIYPGSPVLELCLQSRSMFDIDLAAQARRYRNAPSRPCNKRTDMLD